MTKHFLFFCTFILLNISGLFAQSTIEEHLSEFDFAVRELEQNYSGYPSLNDTLAYKKLKSDLRESIRKGEAEGYIAAAKLFGWFGDDHLILGGYSSKYSSKKRANYSSINYKPDFVAKKVTDKTFLIRIPDFSGSFPTENWVADAIKKYISSDCSNLIIDIRGNGGGSDRYYKPLSRMLYDTPAEIDGVEIRNTPANIKKLKDITKGDSTSIWVKAITQMENSNDEFVVVLPGNKIKYNSVIPYPAKAAIIIDGLVASSGEQFVLDVMASSTRTTVYGKDNTMGALDFSFLRAVNLPYSTITVAIPMTRSLRLPDRGIDKTGIAPQVRITLPLPDELSDNIDSWVLWVAGELEK